VRAPGEWRANVPLMQSQGFATAWNCPAGTPMHAASPLRIFE